MVTQRGATSGERAQRVHGGGPKATHSVLVPQCCEPGVVRLLTGGTNMASGGGQAEPERLDPAKLAAYPKILDIDNDILIPQYADRWMAQLKVALRSRYLMEVLEYPEDPSLQSFVEHYTGSLQGL